MANVKFATCFLKLFGLNVLFNDRFRLQDGRLFIVKRLIYRNFGDFSNQQSHILVLSVSLIVI